VIRSSAAANSTLPPGLNDILDLPDRILGDLPAYTEDLGDPATYDQRLTDLETSLASKNKGGLSIRPYTLPGNIDAIQLVYVGLTQLELTPRELGTPSYLHPSFGKPT
jgi:hypothetical protein